MENYVFDVFAVFIIARELQGVSSKLVAIVLSSSFSWMK